MSPAKSLKAYYLISGIAIIWLGFTLRLHYLGSDSFWIDEIITARTVQQGVGAILDVRDHPPLMYLLTLVSTRILGDSEFAIRIPAFVGGVLALPLLILLGRLMNQRAAGFWAAFLLAITPFHVGLSQTARHYSLLTTISLATYIVLYLALKRPRISTWMAFGGLTLLNLYTHYGSLIVLVSQSLIITGWLLIQIIRGDRRRSIMGVPAATGIFVFIFFLPLLFRFLRAFSANTGLGVITGTGTVTPLSEWIRRAFWSLNLPGNILPYLLLGFAAAGVLLLAYRLNWTELALLVSAVAVPLIIIDAFQIARGAYSRYISFILPYYLLVTGISLAALVRVLVGRLLGRFGIVVVSMGLGLGLVAVAWPGLQGEYEFVLEDWQGIFNYLEGEAIDGDVIVALSLNYRNGFNLVDASMPYYLNKTDRDYVMLSGNSIKPEDIDRIATVERDVWAVVFDWDKPAALELSSFDVMTFQTALYIAKEREPNGPFLERLKYLYEQLIQIVTELEQECLLRLDYASIMIAFGDWRSIAEQTAFVEKSCPDQLGDSRFMSFEHLVLRGKMEEQFLEGQLTSARSSAANLLKLDRKDNGALEVLTAVNLLDLQGTDAESIRDAESPEPVSVRRFTMPHNGDWGDVILVHPPAVVSYTVTLPQEAVVFSSRLSLAPDSWSWGGDGATFILKIQSPGNGVVELFRQHLDNSTEFHDWQAIEVPLAAYAGHEVTLVLTTEAGPAGDGTGDWAGWEEPRLLWSIPLDLD